MEPLIIEKTEDTPRVVFDTGKEYFEISSRSLPEDSISFYNPVADWLQSYMQSPKDESSFVFHFEYISTSSTKQIMRLFMMINDLAKSKKVNVLWKYDKDDDDMLQTGKRLQKLTSIEFKYSEV
jgi:hypothetical protein